MKKAYTTPAAHEEPIGIVISRGSREEPVPTFAAYIWESVPELEHNTSKAA